MFFFPPAGSFNATTSYNYNMPAMHENSNVNYYQQSANYNHHHVNQSTYAYQQPMTNAANSSNYSDNNQCHQQLSQHLHHIQPAIHSQTSSMPTTRFLSPPYSTQYDGSHHINHNYMANHLNTANEPEMPKIGVVYRGNHHAHGIDQTSSASVAPMIVKTDGAGIDAYTATAAATVVPSSPKKAAKRTYTAAISDIDTNDSPALRALLTNRKLGYSPDYKRQKTAINDLLTHPNGGECTTAAIDSIAMSPIKTDDSVDFLDDIALYGKTTILTPHSIIGVHTPKAAYAYGGAQLRSPLTMTGENAHSATNSPMSNYVTGISTPPLSPKEGESVNQMRLCDTSSPDQHQWQSNRSESHSIIFYRSCFVYTAEIAFHLQSISNENNNNKINRKYFY